VEATSTLPSIIINFRHKRRVVKRSEVIVREINFSQRALAKTAKKRQVRKETMILCLNYAVCIENRDYKEEIYELRLGGLCVPWQLCEIIKKKRFCHQRKSARPSTSNNCLF